MMGEEGECCLKRGTKWERCVRRGSGLRCLSLNMPAEVKNSFCISTITKANVFEGEEDEENEEEEGSEEGAEGEEGCGCGVVISAEIVPCGV
jgi:hypothetical protein